ncbi:Polynucleotide 5'-hydroxyl-kinase nol9 [Trichoplax sp. H2]|nr:Polynucleotide 5'-hydroxyl-kinase nol9 [Trichoplax sp. H2]|eukprot:RDD42922.1 Polynucleotide 5'-hydroxyl-kinase nol9 [Trichoplax sp. H2]
MRNSLICRLGQDTQSCLLFLNKSQELVIAGKLQIKVLLGTVDILGYKVNENEPDFIKIYSPMCNSLLVMKECHGREIEANENSKVIAFLKSENDYSSLSKKTLKRILHSSTVIVAKQLDDWHCDYVTSFAPFNNLFNLDINIPQISNDQSNQAGEKSQDQNLKLANDIAKTLGFQLLDKGKCPLSYHHTPEDWQKITNDLLNLHQNACDNRPTDCKILICGGKDVGKSTFCRYLLNSLLTCFNQVAFMESDIGQTEFTPSGFVALNIVTKPVLGPPFTHLRQPSLSYFIGEASARNSPTNYSQAITKLFERYMSISQESNVLIPLIINTHGWPRGLGIPLLLDIIRITQPTRILQFHSPTIKNRNLPILTKQFLNHCQGWLTSTTLLTDNLLDGLMTANETNHSPSNIDDEEIAQSQTEDDQGNVDLSQSPRDPLEIDNMAFITSAIGQKRKAMNYVERPFPKALKSVQTIDQLDGDDEKPSVDSTDEMALVVTIVNAVHNASAKKQLTTFRPADHRDMSLLSYFSNLYESPSRKLPVPPLSTIMPYLVPYPSVAVHVIHQEVTSNQVMYAINGSVVALSCCDPSKLLESERPGLSKSIGRQLLLPSYGLGIVRAIDAKQKLLYILTPLKECNLKDINVILKGSVELPIYSLIGNITGHVPYVSTDFSYHITGGGARKARHHVLRRGIHK